MFLGEATVRAVFTSEGIYSKRKEFAPHGSKFFSFRVDPFQKGLDVPGLFLLPSLKGVCFIQDILSNYQRNNKHHKMTCRT